jgi:hypothetical protein
LAGFTASQPLVDAPGLFDRCLHEAAPARFVGRAIVTSGDCIQPGMSPRHTRLRALGRFEHKSSSPCFIASARLARVIVGPAARWLYRHHFDAVHRAGCHAQVAAIAPLRDHRVHQARRTDDRVDRAGLMHSVQPMHRASSTTATAAAARCHGPD